MKNIKIIATDSDLVFSPKRDENEEKCYERGVDTNNICGCCGKELKGNGKRYQLRLIEGGSYFTEYEGSLESCSDMGWWFVGSTCYKKYKKGEAEITVRQGESA